VVGAVLTGRGAAPQPCPCPASHRWVLHGTFHVGSFYPSVCILERSSPRWIGTSNVQPQWCVSNFAIHCSQSAAPCLAEDAHPAWRTLPGEESGCIDRPVLHVAGPPGCGKTTMVRLLASELGLDLCEWHPAANVTWSEVQHSQQVQQVVEPALASASAAHAASYQDASRAQDCAALCMTQRRR